MQQSLLRLFCNEDWRLQHRGMDCAMGVVSGYRSFIDCWPCSDVRGHVASTVCVRSTHGHCNRRDTPTQNFLRHELLVPAECFGFTSTKACQGRCKLISNQYADYGLQVCGLQEYGLSPVCLRRADCMITECNRGWCNLKLPRLEDGSTAGTMPSMVSVAFPEIHSPEWMAAYLAPNGARGH